jgi:hypothetical protein
MPVSGSVPIHRQPTTSRTVVTDAAPPASAELRNRQIRYGITMAFRTACFLAMIWVPGPARWVLLGAAAILPYIAVVAASQADRRRPHADAPTAVPRLALDGGPDTGDAPYDGPERVRALTIPISTGNAGEDAGPREEHPA